MFPGNKPWQKILRKSITLDFYTYDIHPFEDLGSCANRKIGVVIWLGNELAIHSFISFQFLFIMFRCSILSL
jgi:hypothetical protein